MRGRRRRGAIALPARAAGRPWQFLQRNGVVAALADAVVVVEAPARSGALNTAGWAAGASRCWPCPATSTASHVQGCLALIRDGATLARSAQDVLEALGYPALRLAIDRTGPRRDPICARVAERARRRPLRVRRDRRRQRHPRARRARRARAARARRRRRIARRFALCAGRNSTSWRRS